MSETHPEPLRPRAVSLETASVLLGLPPKQIKALVAEGRFKDIRPSKRRWLVALDDIDRLVSPTRRAAKA